MKKMMMIILISLGMTEAKAQQGKSPVIVNDAPTLFNTASNGYYDYADQGKRMYENNSQFYNKDNVQTHTFPTSNGQYIKPGNSNPMNQELYQGAQAPSGTIYSGYVPVRDYGNTTQSRDYR